MEDMALGNAEWKKKMIQVAWPQVVGSEVLLGWGYRWEHLWFMWKYDILCFSFIKCFLIHVLNQQLCSNYVDFNFGLSFCRGPDCLRAISSTTHQWFLDCVWGYVLFIGSLVSESSLLWFFFSYRLSFLITFMQHLSKQEHFNCFIYIVTW